MRAASAWRLSAERGSSDVKTHACSEQRQHGRARSAHQARAPPCRTTLRWGRAWPKHRVSSTPSRCCGCLHRRAQAWEERRLPAVGRALPYASTSVRWHTTHDDDSRRYSCRQPRPLLKPSARPDGRRHVGPTATKQKQSKRTREPALGARRRMLYAATLAHPTLAQVEKYRPRSLDDVVAHKEIVDTSALLAACACAPRSELHTQSRASRRRTGCRTCCSMAPPARARRPRFWRWRARCTVPRRAR
jgi:hypothetical protein